MGKYAIVIFRLEMVLHETRSKSFDATYAHEQLNNFQAWWHLCTQLLPTTQRGMLFEILR